MWQAIRHLLSEHWDEAEIEQRTELPSGEIHAAWRIRYAGHNIFVKCNERELLPVFTLKPSSLSCFFAVEL